MNPSRSESGTLPTLSASGSDPSAQAPALRGSLSHDHASPLAAHGLHPTPAARRWPVGGLPAPRNDRNSPRSAPAAPRFTPRAKDRGRHAHERRGPGARPPPPPRPGDLAPCRAGRVLVDAHGRDVAAGRGRPAGGVDVAPRRTASPLCRRSGSLPPRLQALAASAARRGRSPRGRATVGTCSPGRLAAGPPLRVAPLPYAE
jgi:hypothetical protein